MKPPARICVFFIRRACHWSAAHGSEYQRGGKYLHCKVRTCTERWGRGRSSAGARICQSGVGAGLESEVVGSEVVGSEVVGNGVAGDNVVGSEVVVVGKLVGSEVAGKH